MQENIMPKIPDGEHLLESANDNARHFRNIYAVYLTVMIYIFVIVLSTEQELLFSAGDKQLPLVHISVPIVAFFTWMPLALLFLHFYLLIQVTFLSDKVRLYKKGLDDHLESEEDIRKAKMLLASLPLVRILVEGKAKFEQHKMLYLIVFVSLVVFPLMVLIIAQIKFLPYQSGLTTWVHRIVILIDLSMLWYFGRNILRSHEGKTIWINSVAGLLSVLVPVFVFIVVFIDFPGSKIYNPVTASFYELEWVKEIMPNRFDLPNSKLVEKEPAPELLAAYIKEKTDLIEPSLPTWCQYANPLNLKGRNFRKAQLQGTTLCNAILSDADFTDADLREANLTDADLRDANLTDAYLFRANLTDADLFRANLTDADLFRANLTDTYLFRADLTDADLREVNLTDADLSGANLTDADLFRANLTDADLFRANLTDAYLRFANLTDADLFRANLTDADLREANLTDADLFRANLTDADLREANLTDADLFRANLTSATLIFSDLTAANLSETDFSNAVLDDRTILDFTWVWESSDSEEEYFPMGIPKGRSDTLKPEYLCPRNFVTSYYYDISEYINKDGEVEQERLKDQSKKIIEGNCKPYEP